MMLDFIPQCDGAIKAHHLHGGTSVRYGGSAEECIGATRFEAMAAVRKM